MFFSGLGLPYRILENNIFVYHEILEYVFIYLEVFLFKYVVKKMQIT